MNEVWKDIKGFEGIYQISNYGRIKSFKQYKEGKTRSTAGGYIWVFESEVKK